MTRFIRWTLSFFSLIFLVALAFSQSRNTGEIRGTVTAAGAVVPGATVTLTNIDTGETKDFVTNGDGIYDTVSTRAGNYTISFTAQGFKKLVRGPITLQVDVITEDASLSVGTTTETVNVEAGGVPLLETETSHLGTVLESKTVGELPQVGFGITGNDWANFNILLPGASSSPTMPSSEGSGSYNAGDAISLNGNLPNYANYLQDGGVVQLPVSNNVDNTLFEAVQEVQINTSSFSAEYGIGGAVFNQITKSGTNRFHGSAYEYFQNNFLNASPYFDVNGVPQTPALLRYDEWGGSIGGPIIKNKLFFFFVRDKIYENGAAPATLGNTPTLAERGMGPLGPNLDFTAAGLPTLYDPASCGTPGCARTSFAAENTGPLAGLNVIPAARLDPVAAKVLGLYPLPNTGGAGALDDNFTTILPVPEPTLRYFGRLDYDLSQKNRLIFSIGQKNTLEPMKYGPFPCPLNCFSGDVDGYAVQATVTSEISPTLVNEFRMAYTKQGNWFIPDSLGYNNETSLGLQYAKANVFPQININGAGLCCSGGVAPGTNAIYIENLYDPSDTVTLIHGKHILHFGVEVLMGQPNVTPWGNVTAGNFTFSGNYTAQNGAAAGTTGAGLADFLLGDVQNWNANNTGIQYGRLKSPQLFAQDDFKVRPNLTVNLGLRYVATTGITEKYNSIGGFDPNLTLVCTPTAANNYCIEEPSGISANGQLGSLWFAPQNNRTSLQKPIRDIFLPRVGFAWSIRNDTVVRGGFGMYSYNFSDDDYGNGLGFGSPTALSGSASDVNAGTGPTPLVTLSESAAAANSVLTYVGASKNVNSYLNIASPSGQTFVPYNVSPGHINQWQLSVEHQFGRDYMASIAYVGSHASNLQTGTDVNQITSAAGLAAIGAETTPTLIQANRPFPAWGSLQGFNYDGISNYNGLQTSINKRFSNGLLFSFNYVWSRFLDDQDSGGWGSRGGTQYWQVANNPKLTYGDSNFDIPNAYKGYVSYELPFGKGKAYLHGNALEDEVVGGWRISGTMITQSGNPFTVVNNTNSNSSYTGCATNVGGTATGGDVNNGCNWFPNVTASTHVSSPNPSEWFNTAAFANAWTPGSGVPFAFGNEGRNSLRGPRLTVFDMSFAKDFSFTEHVKLELRSDWVNVFNHPSLNLPGQSFGGSNFGEINDATLGSGVTVGARTGQLSARISF
jgi:Carboxypeptidase regulatory-like domain